MSEDLPMRVWVGCPNCDEPIRIVVDWDKDNMKFTIKVHHLKD